VEEEDDKMEEFKPLEEISNEVSDEE